MVALVIAIIALLIAIPCIVFNVRTNIPEPVEENNVLGKPYIKNETDIKTVKFARSCARGIAGIYLVFFFVFAGFSCIYTQDTGEVCVVRNLGGSLAGSTSEAGFHIKAPWQDVITYDVRNNLINFYGDTDYNVDGGSYEGKQVSINDKSGASANVDIQVNYSLNPDSALNLYSEYGTQESFVEKYISNDVRAVTREVSGKFDTVTMLTDRSQFTKAVQDALTKKWNKMGLTVEQVSVQDVRYPESIIDSYSQAQAAEVAKQKAQNEQETAKVQAETKKIEAQGEADANAILAQSLNDQVLQQHYIDTLKDVGKEGNLVVVPNGSTPMINTGK